MAYKAVIHRYAPDYWDQLAGEQTELAMGSEEYTQVAYELRIALSAPNKHFVKIRRIQQVHDLGQLLITEQLLYTCNPLNTYYRVRRFIKIKKCYLDTALKFNLDYRRCGLTRLVFDSRIPQIGYDEILIVVMVVTSTPLSACITPKNSLEYAIDYVVNVDF